MKKIPQHDAKACELKNDDIILAEFHIPPRNWDNGNFLSVTNDFIKMGDAIAVFIAPLTYYKPLVKIYLTEKDYRGMLHLCYNEPHEYVRNWIARRYPNVRIITTENTNNIIKVIENNE